MNSRVQRLTNTLAAMTVVSGLGVVAMGCLSRPVKQGNPTTKTSFTTNIKLAAIDKVDILFAIDNSASMGDKQELLSKAVPDLVARLVTPNCVTIDNAFRQRSVNGECPAMSDGSDPGKIEFPPVHDMHIGIVSSSLGGRGGDQCNAADKNPVDDTLLAHNDDQGHLINRAGDREVEIAEAKPSNFLAWFPTVDQNRGKPDPVVGRITDATDLSKKFADLVRGVHERGCGFEAQLESFYRFLVQPDPFLRVERAEGSLRASIVGIDRELLAQRRDFLRPDSLVAVVMVTDENESTVDPLAIGGQGWAFLHGGKFPGSPRGPAPRGTSACDADPNSKECTTCGFGKKDGSGNRDPADPINQDPNCKIGDGYYDAADDNLNVRPIQMKRRFGIDPQYPASRYINGLTQPKVPNRYGEHPVDKGVVAANYVGTANCTNPLFASRLPDPPEEGADEEKAINETLCNLPLGLRDPQLVYFALIGGVPYQLLHFDPNDPEKSKITEDDWIKITGKSPLTYDFSGIDPHMVESIAPRTDLGLPAPGPGNGSDPYHGREWDTQKSDLQFACTFKLETPKDCTQKQFQNACDCVAGKPLPPLCDTNNPNLQIRGKAFPSIRELAVVRELGEQGIVSSLCPIHETEESPGDPLFGYRPAVKAIVDRLKNSLASACLPQRLNLDANQEAPCLILETSPAESTPSCDGSKGRRDPDPKILEKFLAQLQERAATETVDGGFDKNAIKVCEIAQLSGSKLQNGTCEGLAGEGGWCYVEGANAGNGCPQAIKFSQLGNPQPGSRVSLQCIKASGGDTAAPASTTTTSSLAP
ncbi:MAG: hypothetical protein U0169_27675 [Polyangiaceae bacterium]